MQIADRRARERTERDQRLEKYDYFPFRDYERQQLKAQLMNQQRRADFKLSTLVQEKKPKTPEKMEPIEAAQVTQSLFKPITMRGQAPPNDVLSSALKRHEEAMQEKAKLRSRELNEFNSQLKQFSEEQRQKQAEAAQKKLRFREGLDEQLKTEPPSKPEIGKGTHFGPQARYPEALADYQKIQNRSYAEKLRQ